MSDELDNEAAAALFTLGLRGNPKREAIGLLFQGEHGLERTPTRTTGEDTHTGGAFAIPQGSLRALFHNHPALGRDDPERSQFSRDDRQQAQMLKVPSYISAGDKIMRFDPATNQVSEVLSEFPWNDYKGYLMDKLLKRAADDPRGLRL